jgi:restriction system protein
VEMQSVAHAQSFAWGTLTNVTPPTALPAVGLLMQTVLELGPKTPDGHLIQAVTLPWFAIVEALQKDPDMAFQMTPRMWEEMIAGAYERAGFHEVILTPRSGDLGRDIIATMRGVGTIRVIDQVKRTDPGTSSPQTTYGRSSAY